MFTIENKAEYYFGNKPVIAKANEEDEFEGSVTEQSDIFIPEEMIEKILELNLTDFWNQIWIELVTLGCTVEISEDFKYVTLKDVSAASLAKYPHGKTPYQIFNEDVESANSRGWDWDWNGDTSINVKKLFEPDTLAEAVISWMIFRESRLSMIRKDMQVEPAEGAYENWTDFFNDAFNHCSHNLTNLKGKPQRHLVLRNDGNSKITIAQESHSSYVVVDYFTFK